MALPAQLLRELLLALKADASRRAGTDKRRAPRVGVRKPIDVLFLGQPLDAPEPPCWIRNISATGIGLLSRRSLPAGTEFLVPFKRPNTDNLRILYRVTHVARVADDLFAIGGRLVCVAQDAPHARERANHRAAS